MTAETLQVRKFHRVNVLPLRPIKGTNHFEMFSVYIYPFYLILTISVAFAILRLFSSTLGVFRTIHNGTSADSPNR